MPTACCALAAAPAAAAAAAACHCAQVSPAAETFSGNATGRITFTITSPGLLGAESKTPQTSKVVVPVSAVIKPTPPREQRIVWDVLHSIKYPPGYVPRDNLDIKVRMTGSMAGESAGNDCLGVRVFAAAGLMRHCVNPASSASVAVCCPAAS
jgi:hypothetical protein